MMRLKAPWSQSNNQKPKFLITLKTRLAAAQPQEAQKITLGKELQAPVQNNVADKFYMSPTSGHGTARQNTFFISPMMDLAFVRHWLNPKPPIAHKEALAT
jgi:hypothetical protein